MMVKIMFYKQLVKVHFLSVLFATVEREMISLNYEGSVPAKETAGFKMNLDLALYQTTNFWTGSN